MHFYSIYMDYYVGWMSWALSIEHKCLLAACFQQWITKFIEYVFNWIKCNRFALHAHTSDNKFDVNVMWLPRSLSYFWLKKSFEDVPRYRTEFILILCMCCNLFSAFKWVNMTMTYAKKEEVVFLSTTKK